MTQAEKNQYTKYKERLDYILTLMVDRRTNKQIMAAVKKVYTDVTLTTEDDFLNWVSGMNKSNQKYLKKWANELWTAKYQSNMTAAQKEALYSEIGNTIGYPVSYVKLLLNATQQTALDSGDNSTIINDDIRTQKAKQLANDGKTVAQIAATLGKSEANVLTMLGDDFIKAWAKRLAGDDTPVSTIKTTIKDTSDENVRNNRLGTKYMKNWIKRLADADTAVSTIASITGYSAANIRTSSSYGLGESYLNEWAKRLSGAGNTVSAIANKLGESVSTIQNTRIGIDSMVSWAQRLADKDTTVSNIALELGHTESYIRDTLLGTKSKIQLPDYNVDEYKKKYSVSAAPVLTYMHQWVWRLTDSGKTLANIRATTGLSDTTIDNYKTIRNNIKKLGTDIKTALTNAPSMLTSSSQSGKTSKSKAVSMANSGNTVTKIASDLKIKESEVRALLGDSFIKSWALKLADNDTSVTTIKTTIWPDDKNVSEDTIRNTWLGAKYMQKWIRRLADADTKVSNISSKTGYSADGIRNADDKNTYGLGLNYLNLWAKRLADADKGVVDIVNMLSYTHTDRTKTVQQDRLGINYMVSWAQRLADKDTKVGSDVNTNGSISKMLQHSPDYIRNTLLGATYSKIQLPDYNVDEYYKKYKSKPVLTYMHQWVWRLIDAGKSATDITGLPSNTINEYKTIRSNIEKIGIDITASLASAPANIKAKGKVTDAPKDTVASKAREYADQDTKVPDIASKLGISANKVKTSLGATYMKSWVRRLANDDKKVSEIASITGYTDAEVRSSLGDKYIKKWAKGLADSGMSIPNIAKHLSQPESTDAKKYSTIRNDYIASLDPTYFYKLAKKLVLDGKTNSNIADYCGISSLTDSTKTVLTWIGTEDGTVATEDVKKWVWRLNTAKKTVNQIISITGLDKDTVDNYLQLKKEAEGSKEEEQETIIKDKTTAIANGSLTLKQRAKIQAYSGMRLDKIQLYLKDYTSNKTKPAAGTVRGYFTDDDEKSKWARAMVNANDNITVENISADILGGTTNANKTTIRDTYLGSSFLKEWAKRLADKNNKKVIDIANILADPGSNETKKKENIQTLLGSSYMTTWAQRLGKNKIEDANRVSNIMADLGYGSSWNAVTSLFTFDFMINWAKTLAGKKKNISQIVSIFGCKDTEACDLLMERKNSNKEVQYRLDSNNATTTDTSGSHKGTTAHLIKWAEELLKKNSETAMDDLVTSTSLDKSYLTKWVIKDNIMIPWIRSLAKSNKSMAFIKKATGLSESDIYTKMGAKRYKSWVIKAATSTKRWQKDYTSANNKNKDGEFDVDSNFRTASEVLLHIGYIKVSDTFKTITVESSTASGSKNSNNVKALIDCIGILYTAVWIKRIYKHMDNGKTYDDIRKNYFHNVSTVQSENIKEYYKYDTSLNSIY